MGFQLNHIDIIIFASAFEEVLLFATGRMSNHTGYSIGKTFRHINPCRFDEYKHF